MTLVACTPSAAPANDADVVAEATAGRLDGVRGTYLEEACDASLDYEAEVVDLNDDGQPEVFTTVLGTCLGGGTGAHVDLYVKDAAGVWQPQFGFPGIYTVLETRNEGFPDIEISGPGDCFPVWRWNGTRYDLHESCAR